MKDGSTMVVPKELNSNPLANTPMPNIADMEILSSKVEGHEERVESL